MQLIRSAVASALISITFLGSASATLVGDSIGSVMNFSTSSPTTNAWDVFGGTGVGTPIVAVVGAGVEYSAAYNGTFAANFGADSLAITSSGGPFPAIGTVITWDFTDLDFSTGLITNVVLDSTNFTGVQFSWTGDSFHVSVPDQPVPVADMFMNFSFITAAQPVPEPGSLALLGLGLAGLAAIRKRQQA